MYMCPAIFVKMCRNLLMRLDLERSGGGSRRSVVILSASFNTVDGGKSHEFLVLGENLLHNLCVYYCSG